MAVDMTQFNGLAHLDPDIEVPVRAAATPRRSTRTKKAD